MRLVVQRRKAVSRMEQGSVRPAQMAASRLVLSVRERTEREGPRQGWREGGTAEAPFGFAPIGKLRASSEGLPNGEVGGLLEGNEEG